MKLYELSAELEYFEQLLDQYAAENEGDITDCDIRDDISFLEKDKEAKVLGIGCLIKNLGAEEKALKEESANLAARAKTNTTKIYWLKNYLKQNLKEGETYKNERSIVTWRKSESLEKDTWHEWDDLPEKFMAAQPDKPMKAEAKKYIKQGGKIDGFFIQQNQNIQIK
jgi:hypothetical protein